MAQAGPFSGPGKVNLVFNSASPTLDGGNFTVQIWVDLTGITGNASVTASLGGFQVPIGFDNTRVKLATVPPGPALNSGLVYTTIERANARGFVTVVNTQLATNGTPTGNIHAATLTFQPLAAGEILFSMNSSRTIREGMLSSTYNNPNGGPEGISYTDAIQALEIDSEGAPYRLYYPIFVSTSTNYQGLSVVNKDADSFP